MKKNKRLPLFKRQTLPKERKKKESHFKITFTPFHNSLDFLQILPESKSTRYIRKIYEIPAI